MTALPGMNIASVENIDISSLEEKLKTAQTLHERNMMQMKRYYQQNMVKIEREKEALRRDLHQQIYYAGSRERLARCIIS